MSVSSTSSIETELAKVSFRLKGGLFPLTLLELHYYDSRQLQRDLHFKVSEAPGFFQQTPVIIGFESFSGDFRDVQLAELQQILRDHGMIAVALKGASTSLEAQAKECGLAIMAAKSRTPKNKNVCQLAACTRLGAQCRIQLYG